MGYVIRIVDQTIGAVQTLSPQQLIAAAACTILVGYFGIMSRVSRTG